MKTILLIFFTMMSLASNAQVTHIFSVGETNYTITFSKNDNNYDFNLFKADKDNPENFTLPKLDIVTFRNAVYQKLTALDSSITRTQGTDKVINEIFYTVVANIDVVDDLNYAPIAGTLKIAKKVNLYRDSKDSPSFLLKGLKFQIRNVQIVFQHGYIQDIIVDGKIIKTDSKDVDDRLKIDEFDGAEIKFTNYYGIGFSSKRNFRKLDFTHLYPNKKKDNEKNFTYVKDYKESKKKETRQIPVNLFDENEIYLKLGEVIESYDFKNDLYTTDYSPANVKVSIEGDKSLTLYKDKTYKILEARVFSDFLGFNSEEPNGLLQIELEKQFNFNTTRYKLFSYRLRSGFGIIEYLKLNGGITKIEDNNRFLVPDMEEEQITSSAGNQILVNNRYTTPVNIINHQNSYIGVSANVVFLDMPSIKSQLHINGGFRFAQTKVKDSIKTLNTDFTINSKAKEYNLPYWQFYPEVIWHILPETRYGFYGSWRPKYFYSLTEEMQFKGLLNPQTNLRRGNVSNWINEFELLGYLYVNDENQNGKLFIRWRLNSEMGYSKNNFSQFQVGYAFYILGRGKQK